MTAHIKLFIKKISSNTKIRYKIYLNIIIFLIKQIAALIGGLNFVLFLTKDMFISQICELYC